MNPLDKILSKIDTDLMLWEWAKRRHELEGLIEQGMEILKEAKDAKDAKRR